MNPMIKLPKVPIVAGRQDFVLDQCRGKRVLHLGCVDAGLLEERFSSGELLHQRLASVTSVLWGMDIDTEGISFLREHGFANLIVGDICYMNEVKELEDQTFDMILACEVVEHLMNPGLFLAAVKRLMEVDKTRLIVSVPNAFRIDTLVNLCHGYEYIHPDHNYWFSFVTLRNLLEKSCLTVESVYVYACQPAGVLPNCLKRLFHRSAQSPTGAKENGGQPIVPNTTQPFHSKLISYMQTLPRRIIVSWLFGRTPFWGDGIIMVAKATA